jgi:hypothetical protein
MKRREMRLQALFSAISVVVGLIVVVGGIGLAAWGLVSYPAIFFWGLCALILLAVGLHVYWETYEVLRLTNPMVEGDDKDEEDIQK